MMTIQRKLILSRSYCYSVIRDLRGVPSPDVQRALKSLTYAISNLRFATDALKVGKSYNIPLK